MPNFVAESEVGTPYVPPYLFAGDTPAIVTESGRLLGGPGLTYVQHQVVARIAASGKLTAWAPAASDGSQNAIGILLFDHDATDGDKACVFYSAGCFNRDALVWPGGTTTVQKLRAFDGAKIVTKTLPGSTTAI